MVRAARGLSFFRSVARLLTLFLSWLPSDSFPTLSTHNGDFEFYTLYKHERTHKEVRNV